ncbi:LTA synthase family protein [Bdellovibrio sp. HCB117]|uniref:LTA synthase family protein n=1 Tax=Bdellovibrio sp. HCB117 TaxID=3394359 RepID=UPI0039B4FD89
MHIKLFDKGQIFWGLLLLSFSSLFIQWFVFDYILPTKLLLPLLVYASLLLVLRPYFAAAFVLLLEALLLRIHIMKLSYTNTALEASDIFGWKQALFLKSYTDFLIPLLLVGMLWCLFKGFTIKKRQFVFLPVLLLVTTSCMQERRPTDSSVNLVSYLFRVAKVHYVDWNFATNIKENGVLNHLFLTLPMGQIPAKGKIRLGERKVATVHNAKDMPDVFLVLCESCYTSTSAKFVTPMADLEKAGFARSTMISPVYGGMTAEAEFEVLTGLPSQRYKGIDFQYFAESYSEHAMALPRVFSENGYATFSSHNNRAFFWRRDVVHPKFGFEKSIFLEQMNWPDMSIVPKDDILFRNALAQYKANLDGNKKTFSFLITIHTHGPYKDVNGDGGEADYKAKLQESLSEFLSFQAQVHELAQKNKRPVLFLIFGDHKPAMTVSFYKKHVFSDDFFTEKGEKSEGFRFSSLNDSQRLTYGRVPLFVSAFNTKGSGLAESIAREIHDKPIYCLPGVLSESIPIYHEFYGYLKDVCKRSSEELVDKSVIDTVFPEEIYGNLLFD